MNNLQLITYKQLEELEEFATHEGSEWGDAVMRLCAVYSIIDHCSKEFYIAYVKEMNDLYNQMIDETIFIEEEQIIKKRKYRIWND